MELNSRPFTIFVINFITLVFTSIMIFVNVTILPVALPTIQKDLMASENAVQWTINIYILTYSIFVLLGGKISDRFGAKQTLFTGVLGFISASFLLSFSFNMWMMVILRGMQGLFAGFMYPAQSALITQIFPSHKRAKATGLIFTFGSIFLVLGPFIGASVLEMGSWRYIFLINVPVGITALFLNAKYLPSVSKNETHLDLVSFFFFASFIFSLSLLCINGPDYGLYSPLMMTTIFYGLLSLVIFYIREKRANTTLIDYSFFKNPTFLSSNIRIGLLQFVSTITVYQTLYFQNSLKFSPMQVGLIMCLGNLPALFIAPIAGHISDKYTSKIPILTGAVFLLSSLAFFAFCDSFTILRTILFLTLFNTALPSIFTPSISLIMQNVPQEKMGSAIGLVRTIQGISGTIGLSVVFLVTDYIEKTLGPIKGQMLAEKSAFSAIHFILASISFLVFCITLLIEKKRENRPVISTQTEKIQT